MTVYLSAPFAHVDNDEFDDGILKYRDTRKKILIPKSLRKKPLTPKSFPVESENKLKERLFKAVCKNISAGTFSAEKIENLLVCLAASEKFQFKVKNNFISEQILLLIVKNLYEKPSVFEWQLLINYLPNILRLPYPTTDEIRKICMEAIPLFKEFLRLHSGFSRAVYNWRTFDELTRQLKMLETFDFYTKK